MIGKGSSKQFSYFTLMFASFFFFQFTSAKIDQILGVSPFEEVEDEKKLINRRDATEPINKMNSNQIISTIATTSDNTSTQTSGNMPDTDEKSENSDDKERSNTRAINQIVKKVCEYDIIRIKSPNDKNCSGYYLDCNRRDKSVSVRGGNDSIAYDKLEWISCPKGNHFDSIDLKCVDKNVAQCENYICMKAGFFPDPKNPTKFIHCLKDGPKRLSCEPEGTVFNNEAKVCLWTKDEPPIFLRLFTMFIWFVQLTGSPEVPEDSLSHSYFSSADDIAKTVLVAILIPVMYLTTILIIHCEVKKKRPSYSSDTYISNAEEFQRFYSRPPMTSLSTRESIMTIADMYATTSNLNRQSRAESEGHYASTRM